MKYAAALCMALIATPTFAAETMLAHEILFRPGTLDGIAQDADLIYERTVINARSAETATRDTGRVSLSFQAPGEDGVSMAALELLRDDANRALGTFPASVGNPIIMYFYETTARDMSETAGGSPFYIRNRMKDALMEEVEVERDTIQSNGEEIDVQRVTLRPFADDPNRDRMQGFDTLTMTVTMSEDIAGWYLSMISEAVPEGADDPIYRSALRFERLDVEARE